MLRNYLRIAFRNLIKNKTYSIINIFGLAVGMCCAILIGLLIRDELSYDKYHRNGNRVYRLLQSYDAAAQPSWIGTAAPLAPALAERIPEIEAFVRFDPFGFKKKSLFSYGDKQFYEEGFRLADPAIWQVFDYELLKGDPNAVLTGPTDLVISESLARKYFGDEEPIGKTLMYDGETGFNVTGVMADVPGNSHLRFDMIGSFPHLNEIHGRDIDQHWGMSNYYTYVLLTDPAQREAVEEKASELLSSVKEEPLARVHLQPLYDIHLRSGVTRDPTRAGNMGNVYLYATIAVVILLIACINFMNIYTANSEIRQKEVGMRKVLGARKGQLILQFLGESAVIAFLALPIALLIAEFVLPGFNQITGKRLNIGYLSNPLLLFGIIPLTAFVGLVSGSYPAFIVSSYEPVKALRKGKGQIGSSRLTLRNLLVVFQFTLSVVFIAGSLIINDQMHFIRTKDLGYNRENIVNISLHGEPTKASYPVYRNEVIQHQGVRDVTATSFTPSIERWREGTYFEGRTEADQHSFFRMAGDYNLIDFFEMEIIAGRSFDRSFAADERNAYLLNESAVRSIGWTKDEAIGRVFGSNEGRVVGVVRDFNFRSLRFNTMPMAINVIPDAVQYVSVKINPGDVVATLDHLRAKWEVVNPGFPFEYVFYDDEFDKLYRSDSLLEQLFRYFTSLAIFIACLGLFGLASYAVRRKTKEIGIRKVLGASSGRIFALLAREFVLLILAAIVIAGPLAWVMMTQWLQNFAYRVGFSWWLLVLAGTLALVIAFITIASLSLKASLANPVKALRYE